MTSVAQLRKAALGMPETEQGTHFGMVASVTKDHWVQLSLPDDVAGAMLSEHPTGQRLVRTGKLVGVRVPLADVGGRALDALVRAAWLHRAPKRLAAALVAAQEGDLPGSDLPSAIGRPATQALRGAGLTRLDQLAIWTEAELLALHGVGPKAVRILGEALTARGLPSPRREHV